MKSKSRAPARIALAALALCLGILAISCASAENRAYAAFTLHGMAYDRSGSAINGLELTMNGYAQAKSDYSGRFSFQGVSPGEYRLRARLAGYESYEGRIRVSSPADIVYLSLTSIPDLLGMAKEAMRQAEWAQAQAYLDRAIAADADKPRALFLQALLLAQRANPARDIPAAIALLSDLKQSGLKDPSLDSLLADHQKD